MVSSLPQSQEGLKKDTQQLERIRHTCAHIMAMAVQKLFPGTKVAIGSVTDAGFYYDFDCPVSITTDDLGKIEAEMRRIIKANLPIIREEVERETIKKEIAELNEPYKLKILERIPEQEIITRYFIGIPDANKTESSLFNVENTNNIKINQADSYWWDLCAGGWNYIIDQGGGAFYGPKIDIKIQDAIGRLWQCSTIQVDFNLPERFDMQYVSADDSKQRPMLLYH